jgi:hypothetical protein
MAWTSEQILALAPDASSAKSGKDLGTPRKWVSLGNDDRAAWGLCQGSGKDPYQTRIDLSEPAFKCSCPSRKFPCKHSLGLFLILAQQPKAFTETKRPAWVEEWFATRQERAEKKAEKKETEAERESDPAVQAKRAAEQVKRAKAREDKVAAGIDELDRFSRDCVRQGFAVLTGKPFSFWESLAARLVDAQAPGLARLVREIGGIPSSGEGWQERLLEQLAKLYLLIEGYKHIDRLPAQTQADVRALVGFPVSQEEVLAGHGDRDHWSILSQRVTDEDRLKVQRSWLWGKKYRRAALVLQFAHASQPLDVSIVPGTTLDAEIAWFPSAAPMRGLIKTRHESPQPLSGMAGYADISSALAAYAAGLQSYPWLERFPMALENVTPLHTSGRWKVTDREGRQLPFSSPRGEGWRLLALSGGAPLQLFSEWDGQHLLPLAAWAEERYVQL